MLAGNKHFNKAMVALTPLMHDILWFILFFVFLFGLKELSKNFYFNSLRNPHQTCQVSKTSVVSGNIFQIKRERIKRGGEQHFQETSQLSVEILAHSSAISRSIICRNLAVSLKTAS